jgi:hypothetical protein
MRNARAMTVTPRSPALKVFGELRIASRQSRAPHNHAVLLIIQQLLKTRRALVYVCHVGPEFFTGSVVALLSAA